MLFIQFTEKSAYSYVLLFKINYTNLALNTISTMKHLESCSVPTIAYCSVTLSDYKIKIKLHSKDVKSRINISTLSNV